MNYKDYQLSIIIPVYDEKESFKHVFDTLQLTLNMNAEIIIVYDKDDDNTIPEFNKVKILNDNIKLKIFKNEGKGVKGAFLTGISKSKYQSIFLTTIDEIIPIFSYNDMFEHFKKNDFDFLNATRYKLGAKRYGGSKIGHALSFFANFILVSITKFPLSDATTGMKMFKKDIMKDIELNLSSVGWSFTLEFSIKCYLNEIKISEYPINSLDRVFGGYSKFELGPWFKDYLKVFIWGLYKIYKR